MKKKVTSKSGLFLLEMMISILFFSIVAAVCVQVFVKAHLMSKEARDLNMAVSLSSSGAELVNHLINMDELSDYFPGCEKNEAGQYEVFYDEDWRCCKREAAYAGMEIMTKEENGIRNGQITVRIQGNEEPLYQLECGTYLQRNVEAGEDDE